VPYKDPAQKKQWERLHRSARLKRRRELRQAEAAREEAQPESQELRGGASGLLLPLAAGSAWPPTTQNLPSEPVASHW
jgi:hypothetical protein